MKFKFYSSLITILLIYLFSTAQTGVNPALIQGINGYWTFDDTSNISTAIIGTPLTPIGYIRSVEGPSSSDRAVRLGNGAYFKCYHNIPANGGGSYTMVNSYTLLVDFKIGQYGMWRSFYQTNTGNPSDDDAEVFISPAGQIGVSATGYGSYVLRVGEWYRLVISVKLGTHFNYYLDGQLLLHGTSQTPDARFALSPSTALNHFLLFADNDSEDNLIDIAQVAIYGTALSAVQADSLGGYSHTLLSSNNSINPYLQTPTPSSVFISWHSAQTYGTYVQYGTTLQMLFTAPGGWETIDTKKWHTVKLSGLTPSTTYYYRCISNTDTSQVFTFRTPPATGSQGSKLRIVLLADSQSDVNMPALISAAIEDKLKELYGTVWKDSVNLILRPGDMVGNGSVSTSFETEFFNPFANLTRHIPSMVSIGNHEGESEWYYQYMKYEDFSDFSYPGTLCERFYAFRLANCAFIAINTNTALQNSTQLLWLENKLAQFESDPTIDFVFTFNHHPEHSEMWPDGNTVFSATIHTLLGQFPKVVVNAYGHSHNYEHGVYRTTHGNAQDYHLLCVGGAGAFLDRWGMYTNQTDYTEILSMYDHYSYVIFDVDVDAHSYNATTFTLGNPDKYIDNRVLETWHFKAGQIPPEQPLALAPFNISTINPTLTASPFNGPDTLLSSHFQLSSSPTNWAASLIDTVRHTTNIYGNSGAPSYNPINLSAGIDLKRFQVPTGLLNSSNTYYWRVRYRDVNVKWSDWSAPAAFTPSATLPDSAAFTADITSGNTPLTVQFTDLSTGNPSYWAWDFDNDGIYESSERDPTFTFTTPGIYSVKLQTSWGMQTQTHVKTAYINVLSTNIQQHADTTIKIAPNPFSNGFFIESPHIFKNSYLTLDIYDVCGVYIGRYFDGILQDKTHIETFNLSSGVYYAHIKCNNIIKNVKLVKIK